MKSLFEFWSTMLSSAISKFWILSLDSWSGTSKARECWVTTKSKDFLYYGRPYWIPPFLIVQFPVKIRIQ